MKLKLQRSGQWLTIHYKFFSWQKWKRFVSFSMYKDNRDFNIEFNSKRDWNEHLRTLS